MQIDREPVDLQPISVLSYAEDKDANPRVNDAVHIGGLKTSDPRFGAYTSYSGCLSSEAGMDIVLYLIHKIL